MSAFYTIKLLKNLAKMKKTLGGDRLGAGKKMQVEMRNYDRSTHDLSYIWRSTMSSGTLVPFLCEVALPGDTFDINLDCDIKTHPTLGPLFGSYKVQLDLFEAPMRLYNAALHNNMLGIGLNMSTIKFPQMVLEAAPSIGGTPTVMDNTQINPSCLLAYLGIRGVGFNAHPTDYRVRRFNAVPLLAYWDIYKQYYANKQEEIGAVIHTPVPSVVPVTGTVEIDGLTIPLETAQPETTARLVSGSNITASNAALPRPIANQIILNTSAGSFSMEELCWTVLEVPVAGIAGIFDSNKWGELQVYSYRMRTPRELNTIPPVVSTFPLANIDTMRTNILAFPNANTFLLAWQGGSPGSQLEPYIWVYGNNADRTQYCLNSQEGLAIKTYQSDIFNNWLQTEWIDGVGGITDVTAIDTSGGSFTIDTLNLSKKVYDMLNRIAVSGGSYDDWIDSVYQEIKYFRCESPIYHGGLSKELVFQEVVSNSTATTDDTLNQPLGTLAGKGVMAKKHKGGQATIKVQEPSYIIGIISLTPRIDYSQGNRWYSGLVTMDDLHKPALGEIGFQELITEQMAWWDTQVTLDGTQWIQKSAGKQPAWINYMTNYNRTYGNFAIEDSEMFMTLNRRYEWTGSDPDSNIADLTTYIDPSKYNQIFAQTSIDSQNFWAQIAVDITARRLMSAKVMPNL